MVEFMPFDSPSTPDLTDPIDFEQAAVQTAHFRTNVELPTTVDTPFGTFSLAALLQAVLERVFRGVRVAVLIDGNRISVTLAKGGIPAAIGGPVRG